MKTQHTECNRRFIGSSHERRAVSYLKRKYYIIRDVNYRCRFGEIDIIATNGLELVFVEVKYRSNGQINAALEAVNRKKQSILYKCAQYYVLQHRLQTLPCRFDVIGMTEDEIVHIEDAFM